MTEPNNHKHGIFKNSMLVQVLGSFSRKEFRELQKFVSSPFHNKRRDTARFLDILKKYYPRFEHAEFTKEKIFKDLYGNKAYRDDVFRRLSSNLLKLAEEYIAYKSFLSYKFEYNKYILEYYNSKNIDNLFWRQHRSMESFLENQQLKSGEFYERTAWLYEIKDSYIQQEDISRKITTLQKQLDYTWISSIINLLRLYTVAINDNKYFNKNYDLKPLEQLLEISVYPEFKTSKAVEIYFTAVKLIDNVDDINFYKLKGLLDNNSGILSKTENFNLYAALQNFMFLKSLQHGTDCSKLDLEITRKMLELGLLTEKGIITPEWFENVFLRAIRAGDIDYAGKFVKEYESKLSPAGKGSVLNYSYAELAFSKKLYDEALKYLSKIKFNNVHEKLRIYIMYIKIYYETSMTDSFMHGIENFRRLIKDVSSISDSIRVLYENFIKFTLRMYKIKINSSPSDLFQIKKDIRNSKLISNKWIFEKLNELENAKQK